METVVSGLDLTQLLVILGTISGLFIWNRTEGRTDVRKLQEDSKAIRDLIHAIHLENKDFHNRLCKIEENRSRIIIGEK